MIIKQTTVRALKPKEWAIAVAKLSYDKWQKKKPAEKRVKFEDDLMDHLCNGFVVSRPTIFWMGKAVDFAKEGAQEREIALFVRVAVGDIRELLSTLPCMFPEIAFCRRGGERIHRWPLERFLELAFKDNMKLEGAA